MQVRDVAFAVQQFRVENDNDVFVRVSASRNVIPRDEGTTCAMNVAKGTIKIVSKDAEATLVDAAPVATSPANPVAGTLGFTPFAGARVSLHIEGNPEDVAAALASLQ